MPDSFFIFILNYSTDFRETAADLENGLF